MPVPDPPDRHEGCGFCCLRMGRPPFLRLDPEDGGRVVDGVLIDFADAAADVPREILDELRRHLRAVAAGREEDRARAGLPCLWLDAETRRCRHYDCRPQWCRLYDCGRELPDEGARPRKPR